MDQFRICNLQKKVFREGTKTGHGFRRFNEGGQSSRIHRAAHHSASETRRERHIRVCPVWKSLPADQMAQGKAEEEVTLGNSYLLSMKSCRRELDRKLEAFAFVCD